jgi:hypothetical protein
VFSVVSQLACHKLTIVLLKKFENTSHSASSSAFSVRCGAQCSNLHGPGHLLAVTSKYGGLSTGTLTAILQIRNIELQGDQSP